MIVSVVQIGNSRGIRFPKVILDKFSVKNKINMEVTENEIILTPIKSSPRVDWEKAFSLMHQNKEDKLEDFSDSENFEWEW